MIREETRWLTPATTPTSRPSAKPRAAWLAVNFPPSLRGRTAANQASTTHEAGDAGLWKQRMADKGWGTPTWPTQYGGGGLSAWAARVRWKAGDGARRGLQPDLHQPRPDHGRPNSILDYGTPEQKRRHLPAIIRGERIWCLGFSEPGAGSDLASLATRCEDKGDHWLVNGSKIWTSGAQIADWCGVLVRTDRTAKKHEGISFILMDMRQPGVETRPIKMIAEAPRRSARCSSPIAKAAKDDLLGDLNAGWGWASACFSTSAPARPATASAAPRITPLQDLAKRYVEVDADGRIADADLRSRITQNLMNARAHALTITRAHAESRGNASPTNAVSMLKASATGIGQTRAELIVEIMGSRGLGWEGDDFTNQELQSVRTWLGGKAGSIAGGSYEVQQNIISKRILPACQAKRSRV